MTSHINKIANVIIPFADQEKALRFYVDTLGLEKRVDTLFGPGLRWIEVAANDAETPIAICPARPDVAPGGKQTGIAFETSNAHALHEHLKESGVDVDAEVMRMGDDVPPMFWFRDPEGNILQVVEVR